MKAFACYLPQHPRMLRRHMRRLLLAVGLLCLASGCGAKSKQDASITANINGYNSTDQAISPFYVNHSGGPRIGAYSDSGSVCCVDYPEKWYPGLNAKVVWATTTGKSHGDAAKIWHEAEVPIERYDEPGTMHVHFLPDNQVRILISNSSPSDEGYKGPPYPEAPPGWTIHSFEHGADMGDGLEHKEVPPLPANMEGVPPPPLPPGKPRNRKREVLP